MFLLQSGLLDYAWAIISFTIFFICKNWKQMERNNRSVEKINIPFVLKNILIILLKLISFL